MRLVLLKRLPGEVRFEMLIPDLLVARDGARFHVGRDEGQIPLLPELRHEHVGSFSPRRGIDRPHPVVLQAPDGLARCAEVLVVLRAEPMRTLNPLRLTVYNLREVIANMKCTVCLEDVTALMSSHVRRLANVQRLCNGTKVLSVSN